MLRLRAILAFVLLLGSAGLARAQTPEPPKEQPQQAPALLGSVVLEGGMPDTRPKLALVLSGGGARGAAHIGVLEVLEEQHVVPDLIIGTSMGSIVGGLYAVGWTPGEIEELLSTIDWTQLFTDGVARNEKSFRRKQDDTPYLVQAKLRFKGIRPYLPSGLLGGQRLELMLRALEFESTTERDFDHLVIPYRAVAADIGTGEAVVLGEGSLSTAMRASMSISGAFAPVVIDNRKLVDGGAVANLPVGIAQRLGAERIVAVDISSPLSETKEIGSFFSILSQMSGLLTVGNVQADVLRLGQGDLYIRPELGDITFSDFKRAKDAVKVGEEAARAKLGDLGRFRASDEVWQAFLKRRAEHGPKEVVLDEIRIHNTSLVADEVIRRRLEIETGKKLGYAELTSGIMKLKALDYFGLVQAEFGKIDDRGVLNLDVPKKPYGRNLMQFGLSLHTDWSSGRRSDSGFEFIARHQTLAVNRRGGEWENQLTIGSDGLLRSRFYQPLDYGMNYFADASVEISNLNPSIWVDGAPVAKYSISTRGGGLALGRVFEHWGEIRVGPYWFHTEGDVNIGDPVLPSFSQFDAGVQAAFHVDTRDTTAFPRHGTIVVAAYTQSSHAMGADGEVQQAALSGAQSFTRGRNTLTFGAEALKNYEPVTLYHRLYPLGGVFRLSGLGNAELLGEAGGLARAMYYSEITKLDLGPISLRLFAGLTLEAGQVYQPGDPVTWDSLQAGGSIFIGAETPLGPSFFGWGFGEGGRTRLYVSIGQRF